jgi:alkylated DNA repair dioxygenase AlkB
VYSADAHSQSPHTLTVARQMSFDSDAALLRATAGAAQSSVDDDVPRRPNWAPTPIAFQSYFRYLPRGISAKAIGDFAGVVDAKFPAARSKCRVYGREYTVPRDQFVVYFDASDATAYMYSGQTVPTQSTFPELDAIRAEVAQLTDTKYNFVLINRYKDGADGVGWHADNEKIIDQTRPIASVSIGGARDFDVRLNAEPGTKARLKLGNGDLVVMLPGCQEHCQHQVPKRTVDKNEVPRPRINLTFRVLQVHVPRKRKQLPASTEAQAQ